VTTSRSAAPGSRVRSRLSVLCSRLASKTLVSLSVSICHCKGVEFNQKLMVVSCQTMSENGSRSVHTRSRRHRFGKIGLISEAFWGWDLGNTHSYTRCSNGIRFHAILVQLYMLRLYFTHVCFTGTSRHHSCSY
jgi:hypothetical protein